MSLEQYKDANRAELWDIMQIQVQVLQSEIELTTELRKQIAELEEKLDLYTDDDSAERYDAHYGGDL